jgi:DNA-binding response OmpR family regulator
MEEAKKYKILLCEDDTNLGMVLKNYLELTDYDVTLERDGRLGLAAFQREKFDICLLDVMMPNMDGFTLAEAIELANHPFGLAVQWHPEHTAEDIRLFEALIEAANKFRSNR